MLRRLLVLVPLLALAIAVGSAREQAEAGGGGGCGVTEVTDRSGIEVSLERSCFDPMVLRVEAGQTVTWTNADPYAHAVTGVAQSFGDYEQIPQGRSVTHRFDDPGVYPYFCVLHPSMVGAVVVERAAGEEPRAAKAAPAADVVPVAVGGSGPWYAVQHTALIEGTLDRQ